MDQADIQKGVALLAASHREALRQESSWTCNGASEARAAWRCQQSLTRRGAVGGMMGDVIPMGSWPRRMPAELAAGYCGEACKRSQ